MGTARLLSATVLAGGLLLTAACGGGGGTSAVAPKPSGSADPRAAFQQCLRQHGVTLPSQRPSGQPGQSVRRPSGRPSGLPSGFPSMSAEQRDAFQACASLAPNAGQFGGGRFGGRGIDQSALKAFQSCMSQHGVQVSDMARPGALRTSDPKVAKAFKTCRPLLPQRPTGTPAPAPSSS